MSAAPDLREVIAGLEQRAKEAERAGAVRALREAADALGDRVTMPIDGPARPGDWLRDRASRIEAES